jgi:hypothetical protein
MLAGAKLDATKTGRPCSIAGQIGRFGWREHRSRHAVTGFALTLPWLPPMAARVTATSFSVSESIRVLVTSEGSAASLPAASRTVTFDRAIDATAGPDALAVVRKTSALEAPPRGMADISREPDGLAVPSLNSPASAACGPGPGPGPGGGPGAGGAGRGPGGPGSGGGGVRPVTEALSVSWSWSTTSAACASWAFPVAESVADGA